jgi:hypothetical protein
MNKTQKGFDIRSASPVDARFQFATIDEMNGYDRSRIPVGCITYCLEDKNHYKFDGRAWVVFINWQVISKAQYETLREKSPNTLYWVYE